MNKDCFIIEDLLPLYNEGLLQDETVEWLELHLDDCQNCQELVQLSKEPIEVEAINSSVDQDKMFKKINLKLSIYQIIFVGLSFFFAIKTSLLSESFGFILSYTVMGLVTYLFYRNFKIVIAIAFLPIFLWSTADTIILMTSGQPYGAPDQNAVSFFFSSMLGAAFLAIIHLAFALIGSIIGLLILKLKERG